MTKITTATISGGLLALYFIAQAALPSPSAPTTSPLSGEAGAASGLDTLTASQTSLAAQLQNLEAIVAGLESGATNPPAGGAAATTQTTQTPVSTTEIPQPATTTIPHSITPPPGGFDDEGGYDD